MGSLLFNKKQKTVRFECWPRRADVTQVDAQQYSGWPKTIKITPRVSTKSE